MMETTNMKREFINRRRELRRIESKLFIRRFISNKSALVGAIIITALLLFTVLGPMVVSYTPFEQTVRERLQPPSAKHPLGTDNLGRDLLSRIAHGSRISMQVGFSVAIFSSVVGMALGLTASYFRRLDALLMRICDAIMCFPPILLCIALMAALGGSTTNVIIALCIVSFPGIARVVRSIALVIREQTYVEAMEAQGASPFRIILWHIAPNALSPVIVQATFSFASAIITEASLSFLGVGVPAPFPSWGNILYDGKIVIQVGWWMVVFPGILIILSVLGFNLFGDGLRDILDPHTNKAIKKA